MGKHSRHYTDLNPLEGGGSGGGRGSYDPIKPLKDVGKGLGALGAAAGVLSATGRADRTATKAGDEKRAQDRREAASEMKRESRGKEDSMTAGQKQSMQEAKDEEDYQKRKTAPTTKTEMGEAFAKGGMTASSRADGCAQRGKTRGTVI